MFKISIKENDNPENVPEDVEEVQKNFPEGENEMASGNEESEALKLEREMKEKKMEATEPL